MSKQLTENERMGCLIILFPILWPLGFAIILVWIVEQIGNGIKALYQYIKRKVVR